MESYYLRMPIGHLTKGYGRLRTITGSSLQLGNLQKQVRTRIIYSKAIKANDFICRKKEPFGQTRFILLGTERPHSKQHERFCAECIEAPNSDPCEPCYGRGVYATDPSSQSVILQCDVLVLDRPTARNALTVARCLKNALPGTLARHTLSLMIVSLGLT